MRVRIIQAPGGNGWRVEKKNWWNFGWEYEKSFYGVDSEKQAIAYAKRLKNPIIIEIVDDI